METRSKIPVDLSPGSRFFGPLSDQDQKIIENYYNDKGSQASDGQVDGRANNHLMELILTQAKIANPDR